MDDGMNEDEKKKKVAKPPGLGLEP